MKKIYLALLLINFLQLVLVDAIAQQKASTYTNWDNGFLQSLKNTHDMMLPSWGPYSDRFNGISHIPSKNNGLRYDILVQPSIYLRNLTSLANVKRESGYHPWKAAADLSYFSYRFELEWKDRVYCDVSFSMVDENSRLIKAEFVNNTHNNKSLALNIFGSMIFPYEKNLSPVLPAEAEWYKAADYLSYTDSVTFWNYNLVYNGQLRGQIKDEHAVSRTAIATSKYAGGKLLYKISNNRNLSNGLILLRYKANSVANLQVSINDKVMKTVELPINQEYGLASIDVHNLPKGEINLSLKMVSNVALRLDGFALVKKGEASSIRFETRKVNFIPEQISAGIPNAVVLKYVNAAQYYGLVWDDLSADQRELFDDNPDQAIFHFNNLVKHGKGFESTKINGNQKGWFRNIFSAPIIVRPKQKVSKYAFVVCGNSKQEVIDRLQLLNQKWADARSIDQRQQSKVTYANHNKAGAKYRFSQQLMQATLVTNLIYPTFTANQYTIHTTPGKKWSALYTWDSGFIGLGYTAINVDRALESLNAYTMGSSEQSAFLEHGTPLPVQAYLFNELWNCTQNPNYLKYYYQRLKRYYDYLNGGESSTTRILKSGLIKTWDIFYNSGGWDDYSPQVYVHKEKLEATVAPSINTAHQIRFAKLLKMAAWHLGYTADVEAYNKDIKSYAKSLQEYAWDEVSGYYGYVTHDKQGYATGILKYPDGQNFNMGLDGCSPLIAGICTPNQQQKIIKNLFTKGRLWTDQGITAIDQTAPYYSKDGYWNGRVWMPHQWFFWKTMLDLNEPDRAIQIALTALNVWKRETEDSYNCWENFQNETGNGGGWHQFGALSSPVLNWYSSLFKPGTATYGFTVWPIKQKFSKTNDSFIGEFKFFPDQNAKTTTILLCLNDRNNYQAIYNGKNIPMRRIFNGLYVVKVSLGAGKGDIFRLEVKKRG